MPSPLLDSSTVPSEDELDKRVNTDVQELSSLPPNVLYPFLLNAIIENSNGTLDKNSIGNNEARKALICTNEDLRKALDSAWGKKKYHEVRELDILKSPQQESESSGEGIDNQSDPELRAKLAESFKATYHGVAVDGFLEYLTRNEELFKATTNPQYYAKFCSVVQSSGTGKSRVMTELSKRDVVVIYINLRDKEEELGFPRRDLTPAQILTHFPKTSLGYRFICYAFFIALFDAIEESVSTRRATRNAKTDLVNWNQQMCDMSDPPKSSARQEFFEKLSKNYSKVFEDTNAAYWGFKKASSSTPNVDETADQLGKLSLSEEKPAEEKEVEEKPTENKPAIMERFLASYTRAAKALERILANNSDRPKLVVALDEAHPLTSTTDKQYRPADVLCRVINEYSHDVNHAVWVVFASTTSKVADFSPPNKKYNSARVAAKGERLFLPYTQLGWDQGAPGLFNDNQKLENVSQTAQVAGYGRPLWLSLMSVFESPRKVLDTACYKLCGSSEFKAEDRDQMLAVLGQRFGLTVAFGHPDSVEHLETAVASHLRVCLSTTLDRNWRFTSYPSEPFLSCAAAISLHKQPKVLPAALDTLLNAVNSGMIDIGQRGEPASRLLWLLAKDFFVREQATNGADEMPLTWEDHLADCRMIKVVDWLQFIFGEKVWIMDDARKAFENAYVNFSHWVCMDANMAGSGEGNELCLEEWTQRHWQRTSAVQCCHGQPRIDKVVPIYFKDEAGSGSGASRMSQIFISDKARTSTDSKGVLHSITRRDPSVGGRDGELPYIAILADLAQPASFTVTFPAPERNVADQCLRIHALGVHPTTYPFLAKLPALASTLDNLVHLQHLPEAEGRLMEYLSTQVRFGSSSTPEHMHWERGRSHPIS